MKNIRYTVKRGRSAGAILIPHLYDGKYFVVNSSRFEEDYVRVKSEAELPD